MYQGTNVDYKYGISYMCDSLCGYDQCYERDTWEGHALFLGEIVGWVSDQYNQGSCGRQGCDDLPPPCEAENLCGLPYSDYDLGGGWEVCFA